MSDDIFREIKSRLFITDICTAYGVKIERKSGDKLFVRCPFHSEDTASLALYPDNSFYCFGCGTGGDIINFVERLYNLTPLQAAQKINEDFHLELEAGCADAKGKEAKKDREMLTRFEWWISRAYIILCDYLHILREFNEQPGKVWNDSLYEAAANITFVEYLIKCLYDWQSTEYETEFDMQFNFYKCYFEEVKKFETRTKQYRKNQHAKSA